MRFLWLDTETTGLEVENASAFELGFILIDNGLFITERCFFLNPLNEKIKLSEESVKIHKYTEKDIFKFPSEKEQISKIVAFLEESRELWKKDGSKSEKMIIAGYNVEFDIKHLSALLERNGYKMSDYFNLEIIADVFKQVKNAQRMGVLPYLENRKLCTVCEHLGIELKKSHDAINDIRATRRLGIKLQTLGVNLL